MSSADHENAALPAPGAKPDGRQARGLRRRHAVLEAARNLFIRQGYNGTTLESIIAEAGGSRETIYRHFGGKRGLFATIVSDVGERLAASVVAPGALNLAPRAALTRLGLQLYEIWSSREGTAVHRVVLSEGADAPELIEAWYNGGTKLAVAALATYLTAQQEAGHLTGLDPMLVSRQFVMLLLSELAFPIISGSTIRADPATQIADCVELILRAYQQ